MRSVFLHCLYLLNQGAGETEASPDNTLELRQFLQHLIGR
ncbi:protein of unknown function [Citrobacter amalonaticus]|uniref:Stationary phase inducible protein CsiE n=1 Tax=Citrobacter amalonaticus TaxID=35703 RepID=A0AAX2BL41_CITAM|nr:protein of unknown function [Citrobacter amalonaticus]